MILTSAALAVFIVSYALIATERVHRVAAALGGVAGMVVIGLVDARTAFFEEHTGIDWNVIFLLFGMMVIVGVLKQTGLFEFLALWAAQKSGGHPYKLLVLLVLITAAVSPILDNVTCVLLVAPVTLSVCRAAGPAAGAVPDLADPGLQHRRHVDPHRRPAQHHHRQPGGAELRRLPRPLAAADDHPAGALRGDGALAVPQGPRRTRSTCTASTTSDPPTRSPTCGCCAARWSCSFLVMIAFGLHTVLHLDPSVVAMMGAGAIVLVSRTEPEEFLEEVEWDTLAFFMALFVLVGALVQVGVIGAIGEWAAEAMGDRELLGATALLFGSGVIGAFVDNIPYTTATVPIVEDMVAPRPRPPVPSSPLWWAFVFGADLGGNATAVAAGANVVVLGIAAKAGEPISFWGFTKYGVVVTVATLLVAWLYVYLRYFALA